MGFYVIYTTIKSLRKLYCVATITEFKLKVVFKDTGDKFGKLYEDYRDISWYLRRLPVTVAAKSATQHQHWNLLFTWELLRFCLLLAEFISNMKQKLVLQICYNLLKHIIPLSTIFVCNFYVDECKKGLNI